MSDASAPDDPGIRAARWLAAWDGQGIHRTGTDGDAAGAAWLAHEAAALGAKVEFESFPLDRLEPVSAYLDLDGVRIPAVPLFDAPATLGAGIAGRLGLADTNAEIAVVEMSPRAVYRGDYRRLQREGGHRGLVIVCTGRQPGFGLLNAEAFLSPYDTPAIHLSSETRNRVFAAAARRPAVRLVAESRWETAEARNIVVTLRGRDAAWPKLVVMTPRSSWWQSTAERGGGIVCWLETLRALLGVPLPGDVVFTANTGHELGHLGFDDFLSRRPDWTRPAAAGGPRWIHYGANIGAAHGQLSLMSTMEDLRRLAADELRRAGQPPDRMPPIGEVPTGETRDIHLAGGTYLTLVGSSPFFHLPQDRWPHAVDLAAVTRIAAASARIALALTRG